MFQGAKRENTPVAQTSMEDMGRRGIGSSVGQQLRGYHAIVRTENKLEGGDSALVSHLGNLGWGDGGGLKKKRELDVLDEMKREAEDFRDRIK